ncbi:hypothetical protein, partial [Arenibacter palladensis]|uniref:hypothetical protein n=1 Tax=Arenibacter palladensis TaxID=237373 RepID=UPI0026E3965E
MIWKLNDPNMGPIGNVSIDQCTDCLMYQLVTARYCKRSRNGSWNRSRQRRALLLDMAQKKIPPSDDEGTSKKGGGLFNDCPWALTKCSGHGS